MVSIQQNSNKKILKWWCVVLAYATAIVFSTCTPYVRKTRKDNLVRVALLCGVNSIEVSGVMNKKYYKDYVVTANNSFPLYFNSHHGAVTINGNKYRGSVEIRIIDNHLWTVNVLDMEDYLKGVVPCEIGGISKDLIEAAKAQAVAARTYAYAHINQYQNLGFDLYATIKDQVYKGLRSESELTNLAVDKTKGEVLTYNGQPIEAKYHSTCGGRTADFNDAWPGNPPPYLKSVHCQYCTNSPHYEWEKVFLKNKFFSHLRSGLKKIGIAIPHNELIKNIKLVKNKKSDRVLKLIVITEEKEYIVAGYNVRTVLGERSDPGGLLKSNLVNIKSKKTNVIIEGKGYGHGVGMCQFGAIEMARRGKDYKQILRQYYSGVKIKKMK